MSVKKFSFISLIIFIGFLPFSTVVAVENEAIENDRISFTILEENKNITATELIFPSDIDVENMEIGLLKNEQSVNIVKSQETHTIEVQWGNSSIEQKQIVIEASMPNEIQIEKKSLNKREIVATEKINLSELIENNYENTIVHEQDVHQTTDKNKADSDDEIPKENTQDSNTHTII